MSPDPKSPDPARDSDKSSVTDAKVGEMLRFLAANVDDYGFQYMDTTFDWAGWFGHGIDTPNRWRFGADTFHDLLAKMVGRIKQQALAEHLRFSPSSYGIARIVEEG